LVYARVYTIRDTDREDGDRRDTRMFEQLGKREMAAVTAAAGRYAKFLGLTLDLR
jgi:hypothetical protein